MEQLRSLLILYAAILMFNVILSALLWRKYGNRYYRLLCLGWVAYCAAFLVQGGTSSGSDFEKALGFSSVLFAVLFFTKLLTAIVGVPHSWKPFIAIAASGAVLSWILNRHGVDSNLMVFPTVFAASFGGLYYTFKILIFHRDKLTVASLCFTLTALLADLHGLDYAYAIDKPEFAVIGFTIALVAVFAMTTFSTAAILERLTMENTRIRVEMEHKAAMTNAAKLASLGEMAGGVAHEINTPLTVIQINAEQLREVVGERDLDRQALHELSTLIVNTVNRIVKVIQGLRTFARDAGTDPFTRSSIDKVISDTLIFCQERFHKEGVSLILPAPSGDHVLCRPVQVSQALLNLLNNSFDAISHGSEKWIRLELKRESGWVRLAVSDSGPGVPVEIRDKIFQPFFTTREVGKGMGLGLSISKGIVEAHRGTLTLDPKSANTCFVIALPAVA